MEGRTLGRAAGGAAGWVDRAVIRPFDDPVSPVGGLVALTGSLAPDGAIFKRAAATPALFEIEGRAVVFTGLEDLAARIDDPDLDVQPDDVLVLQNAGPHAAGMPEAGYLPIPKKLAQAGVKDMVRISDARMSGTAFGSIVLHVAPEAAVGGPLAAVRNGDRIRLSIENKRIDLLVEEAEIAPASGGLPAAAGAGPRLQGAVPPHRHPGARGLRLRLPRRHGADVKQHRRSGHASPDGAPNLINQSKEEPMNLFKKLQERAAQDRPIRVGLIGAGKFGSMYLAQVPRTPGVHLAAIADLSVANARASLNASAGAPTGRMRSPSTTRSRTAPPMWARTGRRSSRIQGSM